MSHVTIAKESLEARVRNAANDSLPAFFSMSKAESCVSWLKMHSEKSGHKVFRFRVKSKTITLADREPAGLLAMLNGTDYSWRKIIEGYFGHDAVEPCWGEAIG